MTEHDSDLLNNVCTDFVSLKRNEPGVAHLLQKIPAAKWVAVQELFEQAGSQEPVVSTLVATWLPAPGEPGYAIILFRESQSGWSFTADYNSSRLLGTQQATSIATAG